MIDVRKKGAQDASDSAQVLMITIDPADHGLVDEAAKSLGAAVTLLGDSLSLCLGARQRKPDLILVDCSAPDIDGMVICRELKANTQSKDIPVVAMLASCDLDNRASVFQLGAADYLIKPLVFEEVAAKLGIHIKPRQQSQPLPVPRQTENRSEQRISSTILFEQLQDSVYLVDFKFGIRYANNSACQALGYSREELLASTLWDIDPYFDAERFRKNIEDGVSQRYAHFETYHRGKSGQVFPVEVSCSLVEYDGQTLWLCMVLDVSEHRRIEADLERSEALYASVVTAMIEGVMVQSRDGKILSINPAAEAMFGQPLEPSWDNRKLHLALKFVSSDGKPFPAQLQPSTLTLKTGRPCFGIEMGLCRDDGTVLWISVNTQPLFAQDESEPYAVVSTLHDITEKRKAESDRLKAIAILEQNELLLTERLKLEQRFSRMANHMPGFLYTFKVDANGKGRFVYLSSGVKELYGLTAEEAMGDMNALRNIVHSEDLANLESAIFQAARDATSFYHEYRICCPGKGILWLEAKAMPTIKDDGSVVFHGFAQDITERKRIEATLKFIAQSGWQENRETFLTSLAGFLGHMLEVDYVSVDELASDQGIVETIVLYRRGEILPNIRYQLAGTPCANVIAGSLCCYPEQVSQRFPEDTLLKDMGVESYAGIPLCDSTGNAIGLLSVMDAKPMADSKRVVSILQLVAIRIAAEMERDRFERALAESRQFLRSVINAIAQPVFVKNRRHRWILVNTAFSKLIGHPQEALLGKSDYDFFSQNEADEFWARDEEVFRTGAENVSEAAFFDRNGSPHTLITKKTRYIDDNGQGVLVGIILDVTERKEMEAMVRQREEEFRTLAENMPDIVVRYDRFFRRTYVNKVYSRMLEPLGIDLLGKTPGELWKATYPDAKQFTGLLQKVLETGSSQTTLIQADASAAKASYWTMKLVPEFDQDGSVGGILTCAADITELKEYQRRLEVSREQLRALASRNEKLREDERKHIARELHDDLGQRLTALKLDLSRLILRFGQSNPDLIQQVEEMEYDMGATIQIVREVSTRLRPSALEMGIVSALEWLVQEFRKRTNISCRLLFHDKKLVVDDNQSTALFRIVQESLTNIMRYAQASEVEIALSCDGQYYWLEVRDNGVGFEFDQKWRNESCGLIGIEERALSLGGEMSLETAPNQGLKLTVRIPAYNTSTEWA